MIGNEDLYRTGGKQMQEFTFDEMTISIEQTLEFDISTMTAGIKKSQPAAQAKLTLVDAPGLDTSKSAASWPEKFQDAGLTEMTKAIEVDLAGIKSRTVELDCSFSMRLSPSLGEDEREVYWKILEDTKTGKIKSIHPISAKLKVSIASEEKDGLLIRFFKSVVRKIKGTWKEMTQKLYKITDEAIFKPDGGFGLKYLQPDCITWTPLSKEMRSKMKTKRSLLFIHGIFSNVKDAFEDLAIIPEGCNIPAMPELYRRYEGRVYGFDHPTFSIGALENALDMVSELPEDIQLDIVCHSRGGLVTRCLLEHPDARRLIDSKNIAFSNVVFVAGACKGSPLAEDDLLHEFLLLTTALGLIPGGVGGLAKLMKAVARFAHNAPGVTCLDSSLELLTDLEHEYGNNKAEQVAFCRASYAPTSVPVRALDEILIDRTAFNNKSNDLVVPYDTANIANYYNDYTTPVVMAEVNFDENGEEQSKVWHIEFFSQQRVQTAILQLMTNG